MPCNTSTPSSSRSPHERRLRGVGGHLSTTTTAAAATHSAGEDQLHEPDVPPTPLDEEQLQHFIRHGFVALPVADLPSGFHDRLYQKSHALKHSKLLDPDFGAAGTNGLIFNQLPELRAVTESPTVSGALTSLLGPDYVQHPHRSMHTVNESDQSWHKDGHYIPMRNHFPRWVLCFYYPVTVTPDMGPTALLAGSQYATMDYSNRKHDGFTDNLEQHLQCQLGADDDPARAVNAERAAVLEKLPATAAVLRARDELLGEQERTAEDDFGARADVAGLRGGRGGGGPEQWSLCCEAGTFVVMHYSLFHRGGRRLPEGMWRNLFKIQFFRTSSPPPAAGPTLERPLPASFAAGSPGTASIWMAVRDWLTGREPSPTTKFTFILEKVQVDALAAAVCAKGSDTPRLGAAFELGRLASHKGQPAALEALLRLLDGTGVHGTDSQRWNARRAAMSGLGTAGRVAMAPLCEALLRDARLLDAATWRADQGTRIIVPSYSADIGKGDGSEEGTMALGPNDDCVWRLVYTGHALGLAAREDPLGLAAAVEVLSTTSAIVQRQLSLRLDAVHPTVVEDAVTSGLACSAFFRHKDGGQGMAITEDAVATSLNRALATAAQALAFVGERAAAIANDDPAALPTLTAVCAVLVPLTTQDRRIASLPVGVLSGIRDISGLMSHWVAENAAFGLLHLIPAPRSGNSIVGRTVAHSAPPANGDERFAPGFCLLALRRARAAAAAGDSAAAAVLPLLDEAEGGWRSALEQMNLDSPEPWLLQDNPEQRQYEPGGVEWVA
jgi:hypothetical protein